MVAALLIVALEGCRGCLITKYGNDLPAEICGVASARVHALAAERRHHVRCVAEKENPPNLKPVGDPLREAIDRTTYDVERTPR